MISTDTGLIVKSESVAVSQVGAGSLADGKLISGDVITKIKIGEKEMNITRMHHVIDMMLNSRLGDTVEITLLRAGVEQKVTIEITESALTKY